MNPKILIGGVAGAAVIAVAVFFAVRGGGGGGVGGDAEAKQRADQLMALSREGGADASYKSATAAGRTVVIKDVTFKPKNAKIEAVTIAEIRINAMDWSNLKAPAFTDLEYKGVRFVGADKDPGYKGMLEATGLTELVINAKWAYAYDKDKKILDLKSTDIEAQGVGTLSVAAKIEGLDIAQIQELQKGGAPDMGKVMGSVVALRLHGLRLAFKDAGGVDRALAATAKKQNKSAAELKEMALKQIAAMKGAVPFKIAQEGLAAAETFLKKPGTIELVAAPKQPFPFAALMALAGRPDPAALDKLKEDLGLTISAK